MNPIMISELKDNRVCAGALREVHVRKQMYLYFLTEASSPLCVSLSCQRQQPGRGSTCSTRFTDVSVYTEGLFLCSHAAFIACDVSYFKVSKFTFPNIIKLMYENDLMAFGKCSKR